MMAAINNTFSAVKNFEKGIQNTQFNTGASALVGT